MKDFFLTLKQEYLQYKTIANIIILSTLCLCSMITQYMSVILFVVSLVILFYSHEEEAICYLTFLTPFCNVVRIFDLECVYIAIVVVYFIFLTIKLLIKKQLKISITMIVLVGVLIIYMFLPIGEYSAFKFEFAGIILLSILLPAVAWQVRDKLNFKKILYIAFLGLMISVVFALFVNLIPNASRFIDAFYASGRVRFSALFKNPNVLSQYCVFLVAMLICYICKCDKILLPLLMVLVLNVVGLFTFSKSFLILTFINVIAILIVLFIRLRKSNKKKYLSLLYILGCTGLLVVCVILFSKRIDFSQILNLTQLTTGRTEIWKEAIKKLISSPLNLLFGLGLGTKIEWQGLMWSAHSSFIEIIYKFGLIGSVLILAILIIGLVFVFKGMKRKFNIVNLYPIIFVVMYSCFETTISIMAIMLIVLSFVMLDYKIGDN